MERPMAYGLEYDDACQSCGCELEWCDDNRCRGCGLFVCDACCVVFHHEGDSDGGQTKHRTGDPSTEIARLRAELEEALGLIILVVPSCDSMHHKPEDRHDDETPCPIVERIASMRSRIAARERKRGR